MLHLPNHTPRGPAGTGIGGVHLPSSPCNIETTEGI